MDLLVKVSITFDFEDRLDDVFDSLVLEEMKDIITNSEYLGSLTTVNTDIGWNLKSTNYLYECKLEDKKTFLDYLNKVKEKFDALFTFFVCEGDDVEGIMKIYS